MKKKKSYGFILASLRVLAERKTAGLKLSPKGDFRRPYWWTKTVYQYGDSIQSSTKCFGK